eukprot:11887970-Alexandrium_andersonii.AAC.1
MGPSPPLSALACPPSSSPEGSAAAAAGAVVPATGDGTGDGAVVVVDAAAAGVTRASEASASK